jgi:hypothetical protein
MHHRLASIVGKDIQSPGKAEKQNDSVQKKERGKGRLLSFVIKPV